MTGLDSNVVRLSCYDAEWPQIFAREAAAIREALGSLVLDVEHIGSTAVVGMTAKPVIDVAAKTNSFSDLPRIVATMEKIGYSHRGEFGLPGRQFFTKGDPVLFHVHLVERENGRWLLWLRFRDALRADAALREAYVLLKRDLAATFANDRPAYTAAKGDFINRRLAAIS